MKTRLPLILLMPLCLTGCSNIVDIDDLTNNDFSNVDMEKSNFCINYLTEKDTKLIYAANFISAQRKSFAYEEGNGKYAVSVMPFAPNDKIDIKADKELSEELDNIFANAIFSKSAVDKDTLRLYSTSCLINYGDKTYMIDAQGHLISRDFSLRSDLKVDWFKIINHRYYIAERQELTPKYIPVDHSLQFTYKNLTYSFNDLKDLLPDEYDHRKIDVITDPTYLYGNDVKYTMFDSLPEGDDYLCIGNCIKVSRDHKLYLLVNKDSFLGVYENYVEYTINAPVLAVTDVGNTFDEIFAKIDLDL